MNFEEYWKNFGKLEDEVVNNAQPNSKLEEDFKKLAEKVWDIAYSIPPSYESGYDDGYREGEKDWKCNCCD